MEENEKKELSIAAQEARDAAEREKFKKTFVYNLCRNDIIRRIVAADGHKSELYSFTIDVNASFDE